MQAWRAIGASLVILIAIITAAPADASAPRFQTEIDAQKHCPTDTVVWLNIPTGVYHYKGQRWYGRTKNGAFVCAREVVTEGDGRATRNGQ